MSTRVGEFLAGVKDEAPILLGTVPFAMIYGVIGRNGGVPPEVVMAMSSVVFAGSAQLIGVNLMIVNTPALVVWLTTAIVNMRHMLYSASLAQYLKHLSPMWKWVLSYLLTDEAYAVAISRYLRKDKVPSPYLHYYLLGAEFTLWSTWQIGTFFGVYILGEALRRDPVLEFSLALTFIAMTVPVLKSRPAMGAAVSAGIVAVVAHDLPYNLGLMAAALTGIVVGLLLELGFKQGTPARAKG
jgi:predicted branched-subunit amino acid permease